MTNAEAIGVAVVLLLLSLELLSASLATIYSVRVYREAARRARATGRAGAVPLFRDVVTMDVLKVVVGILLLIPAYLAMADLPRLPYTGVLVGLAIMVLLAPPIVHAVRFYRIRRAGDQPDTTTAMVEDL